jgi:hypothetical protein
MRDRPIHLVMDTSAIVEYARGSIHVDELLSEIDDDGGTVSVPLPCLVAAVPSVADTKRLQDLVSHATTTVTVNDPPSWTFLAAAEEFAGRNDSASAALTAMDGGVGVLTCTPGIYAGIANGELVLELPR